MNLVTMKGLVSKYIKIVKATIAAKSPNFLKYLIPVEWNGLNRLCFGKVAYTLLKKSEITTKQQILTETNTHQPQQAHAQPSLCYQGKGKFKKALKVCSWSWCSSSWKEGKTEGSWKSLKYILTPASDCCKRPKLLHHLQLSYSCMSWKPRTRKPGKIRRLWSLFTLSSPYNFHNFCCLEDWPLTLFLYQDSELLSLQLKQLQS